MLFSMSIRAFAIFALVLLINCSSSPQSRTSQSAELGKAAPDFTLTDAGGKHVSLSDFKGKVVLLNFWATGCGPCKVEIPWFVELQNSYKSRGFAVLGVSMDEDGWKVVRPFVKDKAMNYRVIIGNEYISRLYGGIDSLPMSFIIGRHGDIAFEHNGLAGKSTYRSEILRLLDQR